MKAVDDAVYIQALKRVAGGERKKPAVDVRGTGNTPIHAAETDHGPSKLPESRQTQSAARITQWSGPPRETVGAIALGLGVFSDAIAAVDKVQFSRWAGFGPGEWERLERYVFGLCALYFFKELNRADVPEELVATHDFAIDNKLPGLERDMTDETRAILRRTFGLG
jgi:hypothetical protein